ncbi:hypothetical protein LJM48_004554 [Salmonella enterica]|nr:hypothetical protein [Salmonella enterica]EAO8418953.1 hypothetical protein [Salmonella enterica]EAT8158664.1 hypothetical protein [Salmonella enterica]EAW6518580.1 hypothetical protein [Salmonella enterica]EBI9561633.1 hypothetical protein [Salmonella enterica]
MILKSKIESMHDFFVAYAGDIDGSMANMNRQELLDHLGSYHSGDVNSADSYEADDIFIGVASAATGIPEHDFLQYALNFFGHK